MKACPYCAEPIHVAAVVCPQCRKPLVPFWQRRGFKRALGYLAVIGALWFAAGVVREVRIQSGRLNGQPGRAVPLAGLDPVARATVLQSHIGVARCPTVLRHELAARSPTSGDSAVWTVDCSEGAYFIVRLNPDGVQVEPCAGSTVECFK